MSIFKICVRKQRKDLLYPIYITSIVHYNNTHWPGLGSVEWKVYEELCQVYDFEYLVETGIDFVDSNSYLFNQYGRRCIGQVY